MVILRVITINYSHRALINFSPHFFFFFLMVNYPHPHPPPPPGSTPMSQSHPRTNTDNYQYRGSKWDIVALLICIVHYHTMRDMYWLREGSTFFPRKIHV